MDTAVAPSDGAPTIPRFSISRFEFLIRLPAFSCRCADGYRVAKGDGKPILCFADFADKQRLSRIARVAPARAVQNPFIAMFKLRFKFALHDASNTPAMAGRTASTE